MRSYLKLIGFSLAQTLLRQTDTRTTHHATTDTRSGCQVSHPYRDCVTKVQRFPVSTNLKNFDTKQNKTKQRIFLPVPTPLMMPKKIEWRTARKQCFPNITGILWKPFHFLVMLGLFRFPAFVFIWWENLIQRMNESTTSSSSSSSSSSTLWVQGDRQHYGFREGHRHYNQNQNHSTESLNKRARYEIEKRAWAKGHHSKSE